MMPSLHFNKIESRDSDPKLTFMNAIASKRKVSAPIHSQKLPKNQYFRTKSYKTGPEESKLSSLLKENWDSQQFERMKIGVFEGFIKRAGAKEVEPRKETRPIQLSSLDFEQTSLKESTPSNLKDQLIDEKIRIGSSSSIQKKFTKPQRAFKPEETIREPSVCYNCFTLTDCKIFASNHTFCSKNCYEKNEAKIAAHKNRLQEIQKLIFFDTLEPKMTESAHENRMKKLKEEIQISREQSFQEVDLESYSSIYRFY